MEWIAGVDGCRTGWVVAFAGARHDDVRVRVVTKFADVFAASEQPRIVAADMPIGLPAQIGPRGRGPERVVRPLLGVRQSSVFAVPSRSAVYAPDFGAACAWRWKPPIRRRRYPSSFS
jgi:threonine dehydratase